MVGSLSNQGNHEAQYAGMDGEKKILICVMTENKRSHPYGAPHQCEQSPISEAYPFFRAGPPVRFRTRWRLAALLPAGRSGHLPPPDHRAQRIGQEFHS